MIRNSLEQLLKHILNSPMKSSTTKNIAYRNDIADTVSRTVRKLLNKKGEYEVGEFLSCKSYRKTNRLYTNKVRGRKTNPTYD
jgi:hypothetical protein